MPLHIHPTGVDGSRAAEQPEHPHNADPQHEPRVQPVQGVDYLVADRVQPEVVDEVAQDDGHCGRDGPHPEDYELGVVPGCVADVGVGQGLLVAQRHGDVVAEDDR